MLAKELEFKCPALCKMSEVTACVPSIVEGRSGEFPGLACCQPNSRLSERIGKRVIKEVIKQPIMPSVYRYV